jgi:hypothetical protein
VFRASPAACQAASARRWNAAARPRSPCSAASIPAQSSTRAPAGPPASGSFASASSSQPRPSVRWPRIHQKSASAPTSRSAVSPQSVSSAHRRAARRLPWSVSRRSSQAVASGPFSSGGRSLGEGEEVAGVGPPEEVCFRSVPEPLGGEGADHLSHRKPGPGCRARLPPEQALVHQGCHALEDVEGGGRRWRGWRRVWLEPARGKGNPRPPRPPPE